MRRSSLILNYDESTELSSFDSEVPATAALVNLAMCLIFCNKLLILRWRKCLKIFHLSRFNGTGLRIMSPKSNSSNGSYELEFQYLSSETERKTGYEFKWQVYRYSGLLIYSVVRNCNQLQTLMSCWGERH